MRKYLPVILGICVCVGIGLFFMLRNRAPQKKYIAFYLLSNETVQAFQTALKDRFSDIEQRFDWRIIDPALSVSAIFSSTTRVIGFMPFRSCLIPSNYRAVLRLRNSWGCIRISRGKILTGCIRRQRLLPFSFRVSAQGERMTRCSR